MDQVRPLLKALGHDKIKYQYMKRYKESPFIYLTGQDRLNSTSISFSPEQVKG